MSTKKNKEILESISKDNYLRYTKEAIVNAMLKQEVAGQRVFYVFLTQKTGLEIKPENMDKNQSDGIIGNAIVECKLNENEGGGPKKAYQELYQIIPNRLKNKGERLPYYRIYVELETFLVEVYDCHCHLIETFDWYLNPEKFTKYFNENEDINKKNTYEYDLNDENVDLVEVIQNIYKVFPIKEKMEAYSKLEEGVVGWFKPFNLQEVNINRLILNNDKMNEKYVQKLQGAFFTPPQYVKISTQYVKNAIKQSKIDGYDNYVIVDRCSGVGNLESQFTNEIYSHLILGTINEAEAFTANIRFGGLAHVNVINALTEEGISYYQDKIKEYKEQNSVKKLAIIFLENPPYRNASGNIHEDRQKKEKTEEFVWLEMRKEKNNFRNNNISSVRDMCNRFIWSAFKYYKPTHYILFSPVGFWKSVGLIDKNFYNGYICNRKHFNATEGAILLSHWGNKDVKNNKLSCNSEFGKVDIFPIEETVSSLTQVFPKNDNNNYGYIYTTQGTPDFKHGGLISKENYKSDIRGIFSITKENILNQVPLFVANCYEALNYTEQENIMKSISKDLAYQSDEEFLQSCLLYTLCTNKNKCVSSSEFYNLAENNLSDNMRNSEIYILYNELVSETNIHGLNNIEKFNKLENGKLWKEHSLYPKVNLLKNLLQQFYINKIRNKLLEYELLK